MFNTKKQENSATLTDHGKSRETCTIFLRLTRPSQQFRKGQFNCFAVKKNKTCFKENNEDFNPDMGTIMMLECSSISVAFNSSTKCIEGVV